MTDLIARVCSALESGRQPAGSPWEGLMRLYEADREAFYLLACNGVGEAVDSLVQPLAALAQQVRRAVRTAYQLVPPAGGEGHLEVQGDRIAVPADLFAGVRKFMLEVDDKGVTQKKGRDYEGEVASEAEVRFHLGTPEEQAQVEQRTQARREARPLVFRVSPQDLDSLKTQPAYVSHNLLKCARKVVLAPTAIYRDLKRGEKAPKRLREGWAICGKPNRACDNNGSLIAVPPGMVFMVYADSERYVFDWDWVQENKHEPGHPLDVPLRFDNPVVVDAEMVLELPNKLPASSFDPTVATYSDRGDCIFCYICDECGYAERINPDLTIFRALESGEVTGFKIKNVRRILKDEEDFVSDDAPDLTVSVQTILLATLKMNPTSSVKLYNLIIEAFRKVEHPPEVHFPSQEMNEAELAEA